jgi:hypothetical protein
MTCLKSDRLFDLALEEDPFAAVTTQVFAEEKAMGECS